MDWYKACTDCNPWYKELIQKLKLDKPNKDKPRSIKIIFQSEHAAACFNESFSHDLVDNTDVATALQQLIIMFVYLCSYSNNYAHGSVWC